MTYMDAVWSAICEEMRRDPRVFIMGQDLQCERAAVKEEFGSDRVRNTPISEAGFIGAGIGAALTGMRPVVELGCSTFLYSAMDQIVNQAAKSRYMFGGQACVPLVVRAPVLYNLSVAAHHSDRLWGLFAQSPGLKIVVPTTPYDAKGLLTSAMRDGNPVLCFEDANLGSEQGEVPEGDYTVPIGVADVKRDGSDVTIVAIASAVRQSLSAALKLSDEGVSAEVIDVRTVVPLDRKTILKSVAKTGRLIVVDPAPGMCGVAAEVAATVAERSFGQLKGPVIRLVAPDVPVPFSSELEALLYPTEEMIMASVYRLCAKCRNNPEVAWL
jgi:pyruvate dehydrogenase E1 component beta subunit